MKTTHENIDKAIILERQLYTDLANALPSGIYRLRVFHGESFSEENWRNNIEAPYLVEFVNDQFCKILGVERQTFINSPSIINYLVFKEDREDFVKKNVEANLQVIPFSWEGRFLINEQIQWMHFESIPRILENKDILWTGTLHNVSERKIAEQEIILKNNQLQRLNIDKAKFLSIIAHDLTSPFNSIIGFSQQAIEKVQAKEFDNIEKFVSIILKSSYRAMNLLMDMMDWAQSNSGRLEVTPEDFEISDLVVDVLLLLNDSANSKSLNLQNTVTNKYRIWADKYMISTVLRNLISNAIKFTDKGGNIVIEATSDQNYLIVSVKDTGIGISENRLNKLFQLDQKISTPGTQNERGSGLGLIICKEFMEKNKGKLWVESNFGFGSTFYFSLPLYNNTNK